MRIKGERERERKVEDFRSSRSPIIRLLFVRHELDNLRPGDNSTLTLATIIYAAKIQQTIRGAIPEAEGARSVSESGSSWVSPARR